MGNKGGMERIRRLRNLDAQKYFTLICRDLAEISSYAQLENTAFRLLKSVTPGPYTFVLRATREVPRRLQDPRRKTIGLRVPDNAIVQALLQSLGEPLMSTTLLLPGSQLPMTDPEDIYAHLKLVVDLVINGGIGGLESTTVIDLTDAQMPRVLREGLGDASVVMEY